MAARAGVLFKKSDYLKEWKPRHFALDGFQLKYSLPESPTQIHKTLDLTMCKIDRTAEAAQWDSRMLFTLVVAKPGARVSYTLGALHVEEADAWVDALKTASREATMAYVKNCQGKREAPREEKAQSRNQWDVLAEDWIQRMDSASDRARVALLDEWMLRAVGDVQKKRVIDLGCGEGRFSRMLAVRGATVLGIDSCKRLVDRANERLAQLPDDVRATFRLDDMTTLATVFETFQIAVAYLSVIDVDDAKAAAAQAFRVLDPGGLFVVCDVHPMCSATKTANHWHRDAYGHKLHRIVDNYFDEDARIFSLAGKPLKNMHRTLATMFSTLTAAGFTVLDLQEPKPSAKQQEHPMHEPDTLRVPNFIVWLAQKPLSATGPADDDIATF